MSSVVYFIVAILWAVAGATRKAIHVSQQPTCYRRLSCFIVSKFSQMNLLLITKQRRKEQLQRLRSLQSIICRQNRMKNIDDDKDDDYEIVDDTNRALWRKLTRRHQYWIVLVDDEESIRYSVGDFLYDNGYQVSACIDSDSLVDLLVNDQVTLPSHLIGKLGYSVKATNTTNVIAQQKRQWNNSKISRRLPDVLIIDIRMPNSTLNGLELVQWLRNDDVPTTIPDNSNNAYDKNMIDNTIRNKLRTIPIVLLTAKGLTQDRIVGYKAGANVYLSKPFDPNELLSILDNLIQRKEQQQQQQIVPQASTMLKRVANKGPFQPNEAILLEEVKDDLETIKNILKQNQKNVIKDTNVYLTLAERDVLEYLSLGYTNEEIAIARNTTKQSSLKRIIQNLYQKTSTETRTELIKWAIETGYVDRKQRRIRKESL